MKRTSSSPQNTQPDKPSGLARPLLAALQTKVLESMNTSPQSRTAWEDEYLLFAPTDMATLADSPMRHTRGLKVTRRNLTEKLKPVKGPRYAANRSHIKAQWRDAGLQAMQQMMLIYVLEGQADLQVGDYLVSCSSGFFLFISPGVPISDGSRPHLEPQNLAGGSCSLLWLAPSLQAGLGCWICHSQGESHFERPAESCYISDHHTLALFELLAYEGTRARPGYRKICARLLEALIPTVCREIDEGRIFQFAYQKADASLERQGKNTANPIADAQKIMRDNLHRPLTIDEVARRVLLSRTEFTRRFRSETGRSFVDFLNDIRLEEAKVLLEQTQWSIALIGETTGLRSSRLRVLFRQKYGLSPKEYRQRHSENSPAKT